MNFNAAGSKDISTTWRLSHSYSGWKAIRILSPQSMESNKANFKLICQSAVYPYWKVKNLPNLYEVIKFLNEEVPYNQTIREAKVSMVYKNSKPSFDVSKTLNKLELFETGLV